MRVAALRFAPPTRLSNGPPALCASIGDVRGAGKSSLCASKFQDDAADANTIAYVQRAFAEFA